MPELRKKNPFDKIEPKWQRSWAEHKTFAAGEDASSVVRGSPDPAQRSARSETGAEQKTKKLYVLDMFPYPSGEGLHVGHPEGYTAPDIYCRYKRMRGCNVLHPMGFDAF